MTPKDTVPLDITNFSKTVMLETLKSHIDCALEDELIVLRPLGIVVTCNSGASQELGGGLQLIPLDIAVGSLNDQFEPRRFTVAGVAKSAGESIQNGVRQWVDGVLPLLTAVFGEPDGALDGVTIGEAGPADAAHWRKFLGPHVVDVIGADGGAKGLTDQLARQPLDALLGPALGALEQVDPQVDICWLSMYAARTPDGSIVGECLLNNEAVSGGAAALSAFSWPDFSPVMAFVRQYAIFKRI